MQTAGFGKLKNLQRAPANLKVSFGSKESGYQAVTGVVRADLQRVSSSTKPQDLVDVLARLLPNSYLRGKAKVTGSRVEVPSVMSESSRETGFYSLKIYERGNERDPGVFFIYSKKGSTPLDGSNVNKITGVDVTENAVRIMVKHDSAMQKSNAFQPYQELTLDLGSKGEITGMKIKTGKHPAFKQLWRASTIEFP